MAAVVKQVTNLPEVVPGPRRIQEHVQHAGEYWRSDEFTYDNVTGSHNLIELPGNCIIVDAFVHVSTAFDASGTSTAATATLVVPNDTGTETVWDSDNADIQSTGTKVATGALGIVVPGSGGFVSVTYEPATTTVGQFEIYVELVQFTDRIGE